MRKKTSIIIGKNCVKEVLLHQNERVIELKTSHNDKDEIVSLCNKNGIPVSFHGGKSLEKLSSSPSHQGYVATVHEKEPAFIEDVVEMADSNERSLIVLIDSIFDPHNVGAILRACECYGADALVLSKNKGCSITPVVSKISVGASEIVPICFVSNLATTIEKFQKHGYWSVSCELSKNAESIFSFEFPKKTLLILGSEGKGVQSIVSKKCDFKVFIPMKGKIDSLNVSQAAAVFLHSYTQSSAPK